MLFLSLGFFAKRVFYLKGESNRPPSYPLFPVTSLAPDIDFFLGRLSVSNMQQLTIRIRDINDREGIFSCLSTYKEL